MEWICMCRDFAWGYDVIIQSFRFTSYCGKWRFWYIKRNALMFAGLKLYLFPLFSNIYGSKMEVHDLERSALGTHGPGFWGTKFLFQEGRTTLCPLERRASPPLLMYLEHYWRGFSTMKGTEESMLAFWGNCGAIITLLRGWGVIRTLIRGEEFFSEDLRGARTFFGLTLRGALSFFPPKKRGQIFFLGKK